VGKKELEKMKEVKKSECDPLLAALSLGDQG
jgi:hypothetical protein